MGTLLFEHFKLSQNLPITNGRGVNNSIVTVKDMGVSYSLLGPNQVDDIGSLSDLDRNESFLLVNDERNYFLRLWDKIKYKIIFYVNKLNLTRNDDLSLFQLRLHSDLKMLNQNIDAMRSTREEFDEEEFRRQEMLVNIFFVGLSCFWNFFIILMSIGDVYGERFLNFILSGILAIGGRQYFYMNEGFFREENKYSLRSVVGGSIFIVGWVYVFG